MQFTQLHHIQKFHRQLVAPNQLQKYQVVTFPCPNSFMQIPENPTCTLVMLTGRCFAFYGLKLWVSCVHWVSYNQLQFILLKLFISLNVQLLWVLLLVPRLHKCSFKSQTMNLILVTIWPLVEVSSHYLVNQLLRSAFTFYTPPLSFVILPLDYLFHTNVSGSVASQ